MMMRAKKTGPLDFVRRRANHLKKCLLATAVLGMAQNIFDHHHRAVDHHAKIQRAQREQVCGNVTEIQQDCGKKQRKRNGDGDNQRAAHIAQEQE